ncbi:MAG: LacI family DNA-binding transcriptional regulator, partial [Fimbriimonadaceae bacterium]
MSIGTVSNVLNARDWKVSPATRERVLAAVRELNYQPSPAILRREPQGTRNLVVLLPRPSNPAPGNKLYLFSAYMNALMDGMLEESARSGWSLTFLVQPDAESDEAWLRKFVDGRCEGVILVNQRKTSPVGDELVERGVAVVCLGSRPDGAQATYVDVDNVDAARNLTRHLIGLGHRRILHIGGDPELSSANDRAAGYQAEMEFAGLGDQVQIQWAEYVGPSGYDIALRVLTRPQRPTALFCGNDHIAYCALRALRS